MKKAKIIGGVFLALLFAVGLFFLNRYWVVKVTAGKFTSADSKDHPLAPDFTLTALDGQKLSLSDYKGKVVMLDFWATWCGPCRIEIPSFEQLENHYRDQGFAIIGISMDDGGPGPVRDFYQQFKMNYPVAMGNDTLAEQYGGVFGLPTTMVIGRDGRIYAKHVGATDPAVFEAEIRTLLAAKAGEGVPDFKQVGYVDQADKVEVETPAEIKSEVPGVDLTGLTPAQIAEFKKILEKTPCTCGCNWNVMKCRIDDRSCATSLKIAREALQKFLKKPV